MKIYNVIHEFDVDGGFGDAILNQEIIKCFMSKTDAEDFVDRYSKTHVYDTLYSDLYCCCLYIEEKEITTHDDYIKEEPMFWIDLYLREYLREPLKLVPKSEAKEYILKALQTSIDREIENYMINKESDMVSENGIDIDKLFEFFKTRTNLSDKDLEDFIGEDIDIYKGKVRRAADEKIKNCSKKDDPPKFTRYESIDEGEHIYVDIQTRTIL